MKNTFGQSITLTIFGESHGQDIGVVIDGLTPGLNVDNDFIEKRLAKRRPSSTIDTARQESDRYSIVSGVFNGKTTGTPLCIVIPNEDTKSKDYESMRGLARPSHADFSAHVKYRGYEDYRGGGHFSGRITAGLVAAGAIFISALENLGITLASHILSCENVCDLPFGNVEKDIIKLKNADFPVIDASCSEKMSKAITDAKFSLDSVGGIIETAVVNYPAGVGEPWFDSLEGVLSHALFSLGGVKGVEFGLGFDFAKQRASKVNDAFAVNDGKIVTLTNNNGGINGGISNGMPITFRCAVKPTPSIAQEQQTIDFLKNENAVLSIKGRHDPAIVRRICPVIESVTAMVLCDMLAVRFGTDCLSDRSEIV
ncbi:MAG: chorismate synthase [Christensenellaceae bacterium]